MDMDDDDLFLYGGSGQPAEEPTKAAIPTSGEIRV